MLLKTWNFTTLKPIQKFIRQGIYLTEPITVNATPEAMADAVHQETKSYIKKNKFVTVFGGEHSISIGTIRAFNEMFPNLTVLHIDAHADLRKSYDGSLAIMLVQFMKPVRTPI